MVECPQKIHAVAKSGVWQMISIHLLWMQIMIDSTIVRAHQHAAGAKGGQQN
jgi:hypothetical protein